MDNKLICKICGKITKNYNALQVHARNSHNLLSKEYYDLYLKQPNEGICPICGKPTNYVSINIGYRKFCCNKCVGIGIVEQSKQTKLERYGDENYNNQAKSKTTCLKRYGVETFLSSPKARKQIKQTNLEKYGHENPFGSQIIQEKIRRTNLENLGVEYPQQSKIVRKKKAKTNLKLYGNVCPANTEKSIKTKIKNGTFNTSKPEEDSYNKLLSVFPNIKRQYKDDRYPFNCDFYIPEKDLFIECNFHWTHNGHWFNEDNKKDLEFLNNWKDSSKESDYIRTAICTWTINDVSKRKIAKNNNLNYIVFWFLDDLDLWLSLDCPIGKDWIKEYSWLPNRQIANDLVWKNLKLGNLNHIVKKANFEEFFKKELDLWNKNEHNIFQASLYRNRLKYLNKNPLELSNFEILRGLNISGKVQGYSSFNSNAMIQFIEKYDIPSIYDFCTGWGERLLVCAIKNINYFGIDINKEVIKGHLKLIDQYKLMNQKTIYQDSFVYKNNTNYEAIFTCPPYFDQEIYTEFGAENLNKEDFLNWWKISILNSINNHSKYFAYQINQKNKDLLNQILLDLGLKLIDSIKLNKQSNHFTKQTKKDFESVEVFLII